jgi:hypothetical protein
MEETGLPILAPLINSSSNDGGGFPLNTPWTGRPVFSPDGRYILLAWQAERAWWSPERDEFDEQGDSDTPAPPGGAFTIGTVSVLDWDERTHHTISVVEHVAEGWRPAPSDEGGGLMIVDPPVFTDNEHFTLALPTGVVRTFSVHP